LGHTPGKTDPKTWPWPEFMQRLSAYPGTLVSPVALPAEAFPIDWGSKVSAALVFLSDSVNVRSLARDPSQPDVIWQASTTTTLVVPVSLRIDGPGGSEEEAVGSVTGTTTLRLYRPGTVEPTGDKVFLNGPYDAS